MEPPENHPADLSLKRSLDALGKSVREKKPKKSEPPPPAKIVQLPMWPEVKRGVPNSVLRGALFAGIQGRGRRYLEGELLASQREIEIRYTGKQLVQSDLDVWEQALHLARQHLLGTRCHFTARGFLKALGLGTSGRDHEWLKTSFDRLIASAVEIRDLKRNVDYTGSLVVDATRDKNDPAHKYILEINPKLAAFYTATRWTATDWEQRKRLRGKPLALWLHGFYASHANPHALSVEYLHKLSGSREKQIRDFKRRLIRALKDLEAVGAVKSFEIENDLVRVETAPSRSQRRHLSKPKPRRR